MRSTVFPPVPVPSRCWSIVSLACTLPVHHSSARVLTGIVLLVRQPRHCLEHRQPWIQQSIRSRGCRRGRRGRLDSSNPHSIIFFIPALVLFVAFTFFLPSLNSFSSSIVDVFFIFDSLICSSPSFSASSFSSHRRLLLLGKRQNRCPYASVSVSVEVMEIWNFDCLAA